MRRLVVFSHKLFRRTPDGFQTTGGFTTQMDALALYFEQVILCVPTVDDESFRSVGIPIVSTECPFGPGELITHGETGLLVPADDPQTFAEAIYHMLGNPEQAAVMAAKAGQFIQRFDLQNITRQYEAMLEAVSR